MPGHEIFNQYPYLSGDMGIPFEQICGRSINGKTKGFVESGSGRKLFYRCDLLPQAGKLKVEDVIFPYFAMIATVEKATTMSFVINTRGQIMDNDPFPGGHHPDFRAGKFIGFALRFFRSQGYQIKRIRSDWIEEELSESTNYEIFMEEYGKNHDRIEAARKTWSGRIFASLGYDRVDSVRINKDGTIVTTFFSRGQTTVVRSDETEIEP